MVLIAAVMVTVLVWPMVGRMLDGMFWAEDLSGELPKELVLARVPDDREHSVDCTRRFHPSSCRNQADALADWVRESIGLRPTKADREYALSPAPQGKIDNEHS